MNQLPDNVDKVSDIVKVLKGGIEFYKDGVQNVTSQSTQAMFKRMLEEKQEAVSALNPYLPEADGSTDSDWALHLHDEYGILRKCMDSSDNRKCLEQLKELENDVLHVVDVALEKELPQHYASELRRIRSRMQQCHDEIHCLQNATI